MFTKKTILSLSLAGALSFGASTAVNAATLMIDDFSTGLTSMTVAYSDAPFQATDYCPAPGACFIGSPGTVETQSMPLLGGHPRDIYLGLDPVSYANPTSSATLAIDGTHLGFSSDPGLGYRIDMLYRLDPTDLSSYDRIRVHFNSLSWPALNFNIVMWSPYGHGQWGYNIPNSASPFDFDFMFSDPLGIVNNPDTPGFSLQDVTAIDFILQGGSYGDMHYSIGSFSATTVPVPAAAWLFGSGLMGLISVARRKAGSK